ncbi:hypothetical protein CEXT_702931 [Caerostris extrusa]|uniref:Uncharacterized protein n=1 Tax=Caerostris extrusa TaxID=172846 RepID=A0AAV4WC01_CAEEX|nr:hypothetical protein CEXT_702931 [Caerostris extrusa]
MPFQDFTKQNTYLIALLFLWREGPLRAQGVILRCNKLISYVTNLIITDSPGRHPSNAGQKTESGLSDIAPLKSLYRKGVRENLMLYKVIHREIECLG